MLLNPDPKTIRLQRTHALACLKLDALALNGLWTSDHWERELSDPQRICIGIAASADTLLAMACGWVVLDELQITVLGVEPEHRRRGLGRAVLKRLLLMPAAQGRDTPSSMWLKTITGHELFTARLASKLLVAVTATTETARTP